MKSKDNKLSISQFLKEKENLHTDIPITPNTERWLKAFEQLPDLTIHHRSFENAVECNFKEEGSSREADLEAGLKALYPWRKGPFNLGSITIDAEWQSNLKWDRLKDELPELKNKKVLDIGCNSGYYMYRIAHYNPKLVLGVDPSYLFYFQFKALNKYYQRDNLHFLPIGMEELTPLKACFDVVFCMGILYHRKAPIDTFREIKELMTKKSTLFMETLVIEGEGNYCLSPVDRYAKMRNVYFLPTIPCLIKWMEKYKFSNIQVLNTVKTTIDEQRKTEWTIDRESLEDFLDPDDPQKTVEGYPAPIRVMIRAEMNKQS